MSRIFGHHNNVEQIIQILQKKQLEVETNINIRANDLKQKKFNLDSFMNEKRKYVYVVVDTTKIDSKQFVNNDDDPFECLLEKFNLTDYETQTKIQCAIHILERIKEKGFSSFTQEKNLRDLLKSIYKEDYLRVDSYMDVHCTKQKSNRLERQKVRNQIRRRKKKIQ